MMLRFFATLGLLGSALCLTDWEISQFTTTGVTESNTGAVGYVTVTDLGNGNLQIVTNHIPDHDTGTFPASSNPNSIVEQTGTFTISKTPSVASTATCLNMGTIAVATNGVAIFSPFDADGENAVEGEGAEVFDDCDGHPAPNGLYHYHKLPACLSDNTPGQLLGVALDGFPIYGPVDEDGKEITGADLDECNGRYVDGQYRYHTTRTFPYLMGCYKGTPSGANSRGPCYFARNTVAPATETQTTVAAVKTTAVPQATDGPRPAQSTDAPQRSDSPITEAETSRVPVTITSAAPKVEWGMGILLANMLVLLLGTF